MYVASKTPRERVAQKRSFQNLNNNLLNFETVQDRMSVSINQSVLSKVDDFATFKKVEVHAENSTF